MAESLDYVDYVDKRLVPMTEHKAVVVLVQFVYLVENFPIVMSLGMLAFASAMLEFASVMVAMELTVD